MGSSIFLVCVNSVKRHSFCLIYPKMYFLLFKKKYPVDFDDELKIGDVRYDNIT